MDARDRIWVALDSDDLTRARDLVRTLRTEVGGFKIGKEFFTAFGPSAVREVLGDARLFLDLKFHDIPNTVAAAVRAGLRLRPTLINVHASGGPAMLRAAAEAAAAAGADRPALLGVTVLTSLADDDLRAVGQASPAADQVLRLARLCRDCGLDGVVASPLEVAMLRDALGPDFRLVIPGVRPAWSESGDQKRVMTPRQAVAAGADDLVIGRPITRAPDPVEAARRIVAELA